MGTGDKAQAVLYSQTVKRLADGLKEQQEGIKRRGLILSALMRFKQICNHRTGPRGRRLCRSAIMPTGFRGRANAQRFCLPSEIRGGT